MELTSEEQNLINALRAANEIPYNIMLWYTAGLQESADKIKDINPYSAENDYRKIEIIEQFMRGKHS